MASSKEETGMEALGGLVLTDTTPQEFKEVIWAGQVTADLLANKDDYRYSFKQSSIVCPFCGVFLDGDKPKEEKKKPWEIHVENLRHPHWAVCKGPKDFHIRKLLFLHHIAKVATLTGKYLELHDDPSVPKLHTHWDFEEAEAFYDLQDKDLRGGIEIEHLIGHVQRLFPTTVWSDAKARPWEEQIGWLPQWATTHPEDSHAPKVSGWVIEKSLSGYKAVCGYVFSGQPTEHIPKTYNIPIFQVLGPESLFEASSNPVPYLECVLLACPSNELVYWRKAATVRSLKKKEKAEKKERLQEEIKKLPKDEIRKGFLYPTDKEIEPENDRPLEPPQYLKGYKPGNDVKKWWLPGIGNPHAKVWIIGLYPSSEEIRRRPSPKILSGASGRELFELVNQCGLDIKKDVFFENMVKRFLPPKSKIGVDIKSEQIWLLQEQLAHFKPERVICLGADVFKEFAKEKSFQENRGTWLEVTYPKGKSDFKWTGKVAATFHPAGVLRPEGRHNLELFRHDIKELLLDKDKHDIQPSFQEIKTWEQLEAFVERELNDLTHRGDDCLYAIDTESLSLDSQSDQLLCIQISRIFGVMHKSEGWFEAQDVPPHTDILLLRENTEPEFYEAELFEDPADAHPVLFNFPAEEDSQEEELPPVIAVANSEEERKAILNNHCKKRKKRALKIFCPYKRIEHLSKREKEIGPLLERVWRHPKCMGFCLTNANHDRIRLQELGWHMDIPKEHGGFSFPLDTMIAEHILDENSDLGLKSCLNKHFNWTRQDAAISRYEEENKLDLIKEQIKGSGEKSTWGLIPWSILRPYAAKDAYGCAALMAKQLDDITKQVLHYQKDRVQSNNPNTLERAFMISCGAVDGVYQMQKHGMPVGESGWKVFQELLAFYKKHEKRMIAEYQEAVFQLTGLRNANPASSEELAFVLFNKKSPLRKQGIEPWKESGRNGRLWSEIPKEERPHCTPSTDSESLEIIASNCSDPTLQEFLIRLSETKTILTLRASFIADPESGKGLAGRINPKTMCMHTTYSPTLDTNRCRSIPNLSTFPKDEREMIKKIVGEAPPYSIRQIVQAPPGAYLLNRDWCTAEVLGLGYLSQDPNMLNIISKMEMGMDFHCKLAIKTYTKISSLFQKIEGSKTPDKLWLKENLSDKQQEGAEELWQLAWSSQGWQTLQNLYSLEPESVTASWDGIRPRFSEETIHKITKKLFKQERTNIKPVTFGVPYGREAQAIMKQLNREYYISGTKGSDGNIMKITLEEAQMMIDSYKSEFATAWNYLVSQAEHAKNHGFLRDHWGYIRHFPKGMNEGDLTRKAYNYQIQHIVAVLMNQAMQDWAVLRKKYRLKSYAYATLYDNIGWVVFEDELQTVWDLSMEVMTTKRPVGPEIGEIPELAHCFIPTEGEISKEWEGKPIPPETLGINPRKELNKTGLEGKF